MNAVYVCRESFTGVVPVHGLTAGLSDQHLLTISVTEIISLCHHLLYLHGSMKDRTSLMLAWTRYNQIRVRVRVNPAITVYTVIMCLSVRLSQAGIVLKWLNICSCIQCHSIAKRPITLTYKLDLHRVMFTYMPDTLVVGHFDWKSLPRHTNMHHRLSAVPNHWSGR